MYEPTTANWNYQQTAKVLEMMDEPMKNRSFYDPQDLECFLEILKDVSWDNNSDDDDEEDVIYLPSYIHLAQTVKRTKRKSPVAPRPRVLPPTSRVKKDPTSEIMDLYLAPEAEVSDSESDATLENNVPVSLEEADDGDNDDDDDRKTIVAEEETGKWKKIERLKSVDFRSLEDACNDWNRRVEKFKALMKEPGKLKKFNETHPKSCDQQNDTKRKAVVKISKLALEEIITVLDNEPKTKERIMALE
ncbi:19443_t:CDS:2, partial [Racocetra fulgida]